MSSRARSSHTPWNSTVADAFLSIPLPEEPDGPSGVTGAASAPRANCFTDSSLTCPDGLVEQVLWGLLNDLTAPVLRIKAVSCD